MVMNFWVRLEVFLPDPHLVHYNTHSLILRKAKLFLKRLKCIPRVTTLWVISQVILSDPNLVIAT